MHAHTHIFTDSYQLVHSQLILWLSHLLFSSCMLFQSNHMKHIGHIEYIVRWICNQISLGI